MASTDASSSTDRTLKSLLRQLQDSTFAGEPEAQRIAAACTVLLAPSSRNRLLDVRHHCSLFSVPRRIEGSPAYRSLSDLCANLTEVLCARAVEVLSSRGAGASEDLSMQAGSVSEHREGSASCASEHVAAKAIAPRMETSDDSSKHASKASVHLSTETVANAEHALHKRARQQEQTAMMQHTAAALADYGSVVEVDGLRSVLAPLEL